MGGDALRGPPLNEMMTHLLEWLCDLDRIRLGADQPLMVQWHAPYARWALFGLGFGLLLFVVLAYRRESGGAARRAVLALLRGATMAVVLGMLCQPVLVFQRNRVERARVRVLVDASSSMQQSDQYVDGQLAAAMSRGAGLENPQELGRLSRLALVRRALTAEDGAALKTLAGANDVSLASFASTTQPLAGITAAGGADKARAVLGELPADGEATRLITALTDTFADSASGRLAAVVVLSDGRSTEPAAIAEALEAARARQVPIYTVPVGSPRPRCDLAIGSLLTEGSVFAGDLLSIRAELRASGIEGQRETTVRLYDEREEALLATKTVVLSDEDERTTIELTAQPTAPGRWPLRVVVAGLEGERTLDNNVSRGEVSVLDDRLSVLYVEGYPRYEYRYLKNTLLREDSVRLSCLLLSADENFAQEGTEPIRRFPETQDELDEFDLIIFGDVDPGGDWLSESQAQTVVDFVGRRGGGFAVIAGERHAPQSFRGTPLQRLLPIRIDPDVWGSPRSAITSGFHPRLTPQGKLSPVFRFHRLRAQSEAIFEALPPLYWMARTGGSKPGTEVLLEHPTLHTAAGAAPVVVQGRFGAGKTLFHGTDDTWRWRRHTGEMVFDTYWVQVIRALVQPHRIGEDRRVVLLPDPPTCRYGQRVTVRMKIFDAQVISMLGEQTELSLRDADGFVVQRIQLDSLSSAAHPVFEGSFVARQAGAFFLQALSIGSPNPRNQGHHPLGDHSRYA